MGSGKKIGIGIAVIIIAIGVAFGVSSNDDVENVPTEISEAPVVEETSGLSGEVTIGLILPLTGDLATHGIENLAGSELGVVEFNKHLEEIGASWHLKMVSEDSATNPVIALEKLTALNAKGIGMVVGPETSSNIRNIKGYSDSNNMLLVSCCSSAPALAIPNDSVFRLVPDDSNQGTALGALLQHEEIEVLVPVWRGDTWGDGLKEATTNSFTERGGQADEGIRYNPESPEFSASTSLLAEKVQGYVAEYGSEKVAVLFLGFAEILQFTQSASEHDVLDDVRWFGPGANTKEHKLIDDPIGFEFSTNVQFTTVQFAASKNPTYDKVQAHLTETLGTAPNTFVHSSYDAVWIIGLAILETQSTDVSVIKAKIPEIAENYSGSIGPTKLNEAGDLAQADYEVWGIRGGEWVLLGKYTQSDDSISIVQNIPENTYSFRKIYPDMISVYETLILACRQVNDRSSYFNYQVVFLGVEADLQNKYGIGVSEFGSKSYDAYVNELTSPGANHEKVIYVNEILGKFEVCHNKIHGRYG